MSSKYLDLEAISQRNCQMIVVTATFCIKYSRLWLLVTINFTRNAFAASCAISTSAMAIRMPWWNDRNCFGKRKWPHYIIQQLCALCILIALVFFFKQSFAYRSGNCYRRQMQPLEKTATTSQSVPASNGQPKKLPHSIRLVEIPWTKGSRGGIRLSIDESQKGAPISSNITCPGVRISEWVFYNDAYLQMYASSASRNLFGRAEIFEGHQNEQQRKN